MNSGDHYLPTALESVERQAKLVASAVRDSRSGDLILKIVNGANAPAALRVALTGLPDAELDATRTVLTGPDADAINDDGQEPVVKPLASEHRLEPAFDFEAPPSSLTVFRIHGAAN